MGKSNSSNLTTNPNKKLKPIFIAYVLPALIIFGLQIALSASIYWRYSSNTQNDGWAFAIIYAFALAIMIYILCFTIIFAVRAKKKPSKARRIISTWILALIAGQIGLHDFFRKKVTLGIVHIVILIVSVICLSIGYQNAYGLRPCTEEEALSKKQPYTNCYVQKFDHSTDWLSVTGIIMLRGNYIWAIVEAIIQTVRISKES